MAGWIRVADNPHYGYAIVGNIPNSYSVGDLRWFFLDAIKKQQFTCFHYCYRDDQRSSARPNIPDTGQNGNAKTAVNDAKDQQVSGQTNRKVAFSLGSVISELSQAIEEGDSQTNAGEQSSSQSSGADVDIIQKDKQRKSNGPGCCIVEFEDEETRDVFVALYDGHPWVDSDGNDLTEQCHITPVSFKPTNINDTDFSSASTLHLSSRCLGQSPYIDELSKEDPYPKGNVGTAADVLAKFVMCGRVGPEEALELGLPPESAVRDLYLTTNSAAASHNDFAYATVGNIPGFYSIADVRWFFLDAINKQQFSCFHYRYREDTVSGEMFGTGSSIANGNGPGETSGFHRSATMIGICALSSGDVENGHLPRSATTSNLSNAGGIGEKAENPGCCIVEFENAETRDVFAALYDGKAWIDGEGNKLRSHCCASRVNLSDEGAQIGSHDGVPCHAFKLSSACLTVSPYAEELYKVNPYPKGNVGTSKEVLMDFVSCGRIATETAAELGLMDEPGDGEYASVMAEMTGDYAYAVVYNIPHFYRSKNLRWHFEECVNDGGFLMFNFQHRLSQESYSPNVMASYECVCKVTLSALEHLLVWYHDNPWTDADGNPLATNCLLRPLHPDENLDSKRVLKELYSSSVLPRGNVGTLDEQLWAAWEQGHLSSPVAKRLGLLDEHEAGHIEEDIQYETRADGTSHKLSRRKKRAKRQGMNTSLLILDEKPERIDPNNPNAPIGAFEAHTKSIGRKLMEKLGWKDGEGLGKESEGKAIPVAVEMNTASNKGMSKKGLGHKRKRKAVGVPFANKMPFGFRVDIADDGN